jgi:hypothetical protein
MLYNVLGVTSIIIFLAMCGLNIFVYLAKGTETISDFVEDILAKITGKFGKDTSGFFSVIFKALIVGFDSASMVGGAAQTAAAVTGAGIAIADSTAGVPIPAGYSAPSTSSSYTQKAAPASPPQPPPPAPPKPAADSVNSMIQTNVAKNKAGWCYIGEDRGYRSCLEVKEDEGCMSAQVFSSQESCLNPELRYD